jgi:hypothetical protein
VRSRPCRFRLIRSCSSSRAPACREGGSTNRIPARCSSTSASRSAVRGGDVLEVAAHDESAGVVFYTLEQRADATTGPPQFKRAFQCLGCHVTGNTLGVPGLLMFSTTRREPSQYSGLPRPIGHSDSLARRFGGWFVTGSTGSVQHMGNDVPALDGRTNRELMSVDGLFDADGYCAVSSDIAAHLVLTWNVWSGSISAIVQTPKPWKCTSF